MTIAEKARFRPREMPANERPISEEYRIAAKEWVDAEKTAALYEETKTSVLSQMMMALGDMPVSKAEMRVKASDDWREFIEKMVEARAHANYSKVKLEWIRLRERELDRTSWSERTERKMARSTP